jgi:predicted transcriptional regulator
MARRSSSHPTELELEILKILWRDGPAPVRQVRDALAGTRDLAYTTVMTMMSIMTKKQYLRRSKGRSGYVYRPCIDRESTERTMLRDLVDRVFDGSPSAVMLHLLETADLDAGELQRLRALLDQDWEEEK